jgi:hypothetical protein
MGTFWVVIFAKFASNAIQIGVPLANLGTQIRVPRVSKPPLLPL